MQGELAAKQGRQRADVEIISRHLLLVLFDAERSWALAQDLKAQLATSRIVTTRAQTWHRLVQRLTKAIQHASLLAKLTQQINASSLPQAEAAAYHWVLQASLSFERGDEKGAKASLERLANARPVLERIAQKSALVSSQSFAYELLEDVDQMWRIGMHRLSLSSAPSVETLPETSALLDHLGEIKSAAVQHRTEFTWRAQTYTILNPTLSKAVTESELSAKGDSLASLEAKLTILGSAEDLAQRLVSDNQVCSSSLHRL